jgi:hypothetical protein
MADIQCSIPADTVPHNIAWKATVSPRQECAAAMGVYRVRSGRNAIDAWRSMNSGYNRGGGRSFTPRAQLRRTLKQL